jgi:hypothetical protein
VAPGVALSAGSAVAIGPAGGALDLHGAISTHPAVTGCPRWPARLRLASATGKLVPGRCRATNLCGYCQALYIVETVEMLTLDALEVAPTCWLVLTAREHLTRPDTYAHLAKLRKALRKRWPAIEWCVQVEFQRRGALHLNLVVKGVPSSDAECVAWAMHDPALPVMPEHACGDCLRCRAAVQWCSRLDAVPGAQWCGSVDDAGGVVKYLGKMLAHGLKAEQRPPVGWKGQRTSYTRGYLVRPAWKMRAEARAALRLKREIFKAEAAGLVGAEALHVAELVALRASQVEWECVVLTHDPVVGDYGVDDDTGELVQRVRPLSGGDVTVAMRSDAPRARRRCCTDDIERAITESRALRSSSPSSSSTDDASASSDVHAPPARSRRRSAPTQVPLPGIAASTSERSPAGRASRASRRRARRSP